MGENTIYIIIAVLASIYLFISIYNKRRSRNRKSRKFMDNYKRKEDKDWAQSSKLINNYS